MNHIQWYSWLQQCSDAPILAHFEASFFQAACPRAGDWLLNMVCPFIGVQTTSWQNIVRVICQQYCLPADVCADVLYTPWRDETFHYLLVSHGLECASEPEYYWQEWHRITRPQGKLLLTHINAHSWWYRRLPENIRQNLSTHLPDKLIEQAEMVGWQLEQCRFMWHAPFFRQPEQVWAKIGDKMLSTMMPQSAVIYGLVFSKQIIGLNREVQPEYSFLLPSLNTLSAVRKTAFRLPSSTQ